jgi:hypothetical protein
VLERRINPGTQPITQQEFLHALVMIETYVVRQNKFPGIGTAMHAGSDPAQMSAPIIPVEAIEIEGDEDKHEGTMSSQSPGGRPLPTRSRCTNCAIPVVEYKQGGQSHKFYG